VSRLPATSRNRLRRNEIREPARFPWSPIVGGTLPSLLFKYEASNSASHRRDLMLLVQVAGLLATGWLIWSVALLPRLNRESLADVITQTLAYTLLAFLASAVITVSLYLLIARSVSDDAIQMALRTSSTAVWFAAATILLAQLSLATLPAALVLVISATRLLYSQWRLVHSPEPSPIGAPVEHPFFDPPPGPSLRELIPALAASLAIEAGALVFPVGYPLLAAALFSLSVAMVTLCALRAGVSQSEAPGNLPRSILGFLLTLVLAAGLTVGGVAGSADSGSHWHSPLQHAPGPLQSARALLHKFFEENGDGQPKRPTATNLYLPPIDNVQITDKSFPGVVLLPETKPEKPFLLAPSFSWNRTPPDVAAIKTFSIPFSGVYWMYRSPYDRPPPTSHVQQGNPLALSFRTTDRAPMFMEAYQKLGRTIETRCCSAIQIAISNTDRYSGTVALELVLIDSQSPSQPMFSLGNAAVTSGPRGGSTAGGAVPVPETLDFAIPASAPLHQFDVIKVIFHRDSLRMDASARISIERFLLSPR
jgi:hypothetical protein